ncbi:DUF4365 domain-containing protein [Nocardioides taihuensis]|uniref:DUF4365 domain-containing protein n=1 Tax=Nocardioides taihuensis TaxID=1835606 RepID=A0ABW0BJ31_9ACTN
MPMSRPPSAVTERAGVFAVGGIVNGFGWVFREQPTDDYGIDAQAEVFEPGGTATGKLIALQIKSGRAKYFASEKGNGWTHYVDSKHAEYWLKHSLPVVVVLYDEIDGKAYWQRVTRATLDATPNNFKIFVPRSQELDAASVVPLREFAEGDPYSVRLRRLQLALPWMELLRAGRRILIEADEWVNKSSGRGEITIASVDGANEDRELLGTWMIMAPGWSYDTVLPSLVPWADVVIHEETYDEAEYDAWEAECVYYDNEGDRIVTEDYDEWRGERGVEGLRPYANSAGEVDSWRLELKLNQLGDAFLLVNEFAEGTGLFLAPDAN